MVSCTLKSQSLPAARSSVSANSWLTPCGSFCSSGCPQRHRSGVPARRETTLPTSRISENGLPDNSITAIAQTPDGYLWVGTYNGLARFDGVRFVTFDPANTPELTHARIRKLFVDSQGTLWINTYDGSLTTLRHGTFALERRNTRSSEAEMALVSSSSNRVIFLTSRGGLLRKPLTAPAGAGWEELSPPSRGLGALCCEDDKGTLWYRNTNRRLWRLAGDRFEPLPDTAGFGEQDINCLVTDPHGRLWMATDREIAIWDGARFQIRTPTNAEPPLGVTFMSVTADGQVWMVANGNVGEAANRRWIVRPEAARSIFKGNPGRIGALEDHHGGMWFYSFGRGLLHVDIAGEVRQLTSKDGFPGERVNCFFRRSGGQLVGRPGGGGIGSVARTAVPYGCPRQCGFGEGGQVRLSRFQRCGMDWNTERRPELLARGK